MSKRFEHQLERGISNLPRINTVEHQLQRGTSDSPRVHHVRQQPLQLVPDQRVMDIHMLDEQRVDTYTLDRSTTSSYVVGIEVESLKKTPSA